MLRREVNGINLNIIDAMLENLSLDAIYSRVISFKPDIIITILSANHLGEKEERFCAELPFLTISIITPTSTNSKEAVDMYKLKSKFFLNTDETELTITNAVKEFIRTGDINDTAGLIINDHGKIGFTGTPEYSDMERYPMPAFDLLSCRQYIELQKGIISRYGRGRTTIINPCKGCDYHCIFCVVGKDIYRGRQKNPQQIFDEIKYLYENLGIQRFVFINGIFGINLENAKELCRMIINSKITISFLINNRIEFVDEELLQLLKLANCEVVRYGLETADPNLQLGINKNLNLERTEKIINLTKKYGIKVHLYMITGLPGETRESLRKNAQFVLKTKPDWVYWGILFPELGSPFYDYLKTNNLLVEQDWSWYRKTDKLCFKHSTYSSINDIKKANLWMQNLYRKGLLCDSALSSIKKLSYLIKYCASEFNLLTWDFTHRYKFTRDLEEFFAGKLSLLLKRFSSSDIL